MNGNWLNDASPAQITKATIVAATLFVLSGATMAGRAVYGTAQNKAAEMRIMTLNTQLREAQGSMRHVNEVLASGPHIEGPSGKPIVVEFQSAAVKAGRANDVKIEFTQVGDPNLFISRFMNTPDDTLQQIEIQVSLNGSLADVIRTLDQFSNFRIPFELGEMQFARDTSVAGTGKVLARTSVFVLVPKETTP